MQGRETRWRMPVLPAIGLSVSVTALAQGSEEIEFTSKG